jgi:hypothetical protein
MQLIILSIVTGFIGTAIYGFWLQGREPQIKHSLTSATRSLRRKRRVRAYISAIKGDLAIESARRTVFIHANLILALLALLLLLIMGMIAIQRDRMDFLNRLNTYLADKGQDHDSFPEHSLEEIKAFRLQLKNHVRYTELFVHTLLFGVAPVGILTFGWVGLIIAPYVHRRSAFLFRLDRLRRVLPVVCTREELVELVMLEQAVDDEKSLRTFANAVLRVGNEHGLQDLVSDFDLWKDGPRNTEQSKNVVAGQNEDSPR